MTDIFESNNLSYICHSIAVDKGFYSPDKTPKELYAITWRQLCHVIDELNEYVTAQTYETATEELADIIIVICDLLGAYNIPVYTAQELPNVEFMYDDDHVMFIMSKIGEISNIFRKTGVLKYQLLLDIMTHVAAIIEYQQSQDWLSVVIYKCRKNIGRDKGYGVK